MNSYPQAESGLGGAVAVLRAGDTVILLFPPATTFDQSKHAYDRLRADFPDINWYVMSGPTHVLHKPAQDGIATHA